MAHTKCAVYTGLKDVINSFSVARDSFHRAEELLSALDSQFNGLKLLDESPKRKKATGCRQPGENTPQPTENDDQSCITEQWSTTTNPQMLLRSVAKKDTDQLQSGSSAFDSPVPPSLNIMTPSVNAEPILQAQAGSAEKQSAAPKPLSVCLPKKKTNICLSAFPPRCWTIYNLVSFPI